MPTALIHIGVPKTGTTSFQRWIHHNRKVLRAQRDITLYEGFVGQVRRAPMHPELLLLTQRPERDCVAKLNIPQWSTPEWQRAAGAHLAAQVDSDAETLLFTLEGLFLLRHADEIERLVQLLAPRTIRVAVCLRDPASFLQSYRAQMAKNDIATSADPTSSLYLEDGSWLADWDHLLSVWRSVLGEDDVVAFDYEEAMSAHGSTTRGVLDALGVETVGLPDLDTIRSNRSGHPGIARLSRRITRRLRRLVI